MSAVGNERVFAPLIGSIHRPSSQLGENNQFMISHAQLSIYIIILYITKNYYELILVT